MATEEQPVSVQDRWHELFKGTGHRCGAGTLQLLVQIADIQIFAQQWSSSETQSQAHQAHSACLWNPPVLAPFWACASMPVRHQQQRCSTAAPQWCVPGSHRTIAASCQHHRLQPWVTSTGGCTVSKLATISPLHTQTTPEFPAEKLLPCLTPQALAASTLLTPALSSTCWCGGTGPRW